MPIERLLDAPSLGQPTPVAPHIQWIRLPLPFALDHINVWLIEEEDQYTLVDTGVYQPNVIDLWRTLSSELFANKPLGRIIITHAHPDHIGMAAQLSEVHQAGVWISCGEYFAARALSADLPGVDAVAFANFLASHGLAQGPKAQETQRARGGLFAKLVPEMPLQYHRIQHGDTLQIGQHTWRCMAGFGHSPEHISLICEPLGLMISGDMLLPNISTNISVYASEPDGDPLCLFLQSLQDMLALPNHLTVLPSHGVPFKGIHERCEQLLRHHEHRLNDLLSAIQNTPMNARQAIATLFRREMDGHQMSFAMGEAIAHLNHLWYQGKIQRTQEQGIWMFCAPPPTP